jgi:hypothetical protein
MEMVNLTEKLTLFSDQRRLKIVGDLNGRQVRLVKFQGVRCKSEVKTCRRKDLRENLRH